MNHPQSSLYLGTSSFSTKDWVGPFYPPKTNPRDYLKFYSAHFKAVEIDSTYYGVPQPYMIKRWNEATPEHFVIAAKFPRDIVHAGQGAVPDARTLLTEEVYEVRDEFLNMIQGLGPRLGPLVLQFPFFSKYVFPQLQVFLDRLDTFLDTLPDSFRYAVEVRNKELVTSDIMEICRKHGAAFVLVDQGWMPHGEEVMDQWNSVTTDFAYIRLLGDHKEMEKVTQTWEKEVVDRTESIARWAAVIADLLSKEVPVFAFANNHYAGHAPATARKLSNAVKALRGEEEDEAWRPDLFS